MLLFLGGYLLLSLVVLPLFQATGNHWQYGSAEISQYDFNVGHGGISHFIAEDSNGTVIVIEIVEAGSYPSHVYIDHLFTIDHNQHVVMLSLSDPNHTGKPNLMVTVSGDAMPLMLYNNGTEFTPNEG